MPQANKACCNLLDASLDYLSKSDEEYIAFLQSLEAPSTRPYDVDQLLEMLGSHCVYINHLMHTLIYIYYTHL